MPALLILKLVSEIYIAYPVYISKKTEDITRMQSGEIIYKVIEEMTSELSQEQLFKLQSVLIKNMAGDIEEENHTANDNESYLSLFEQAKRVEGLSERGERVRLINLQMR